MAFGFGRQPQGDGRSQYQQPQYGQQQYGQPQYQQQYAPQQPYGGQPQYAQTTGYNQSYANGYTQPVMDANAVYTAENYAKSTRISTAKAYAEMTIGLLVTAVTAVLSYTSGLLMAYVSATGSIGWIILALAQVGIAFFLGMRVTSMNPGTARVIFYVYAALMGFTLSSIFGVYSLGTIVLTLAMTAGFFLCLTMFALTTKINMLKAGPILMVALLVLIVMEVILAFFVHSSTFTMIVSAIALVIFAGLTMHDAQFTREMFHSYSNDEVMIKRISILCALNLYLDFINFFVNLLTIFGSSDN